MAVALRDLARQLGLELRGDGGRRVTRVAALDADCPDGLGFLANRRYRKHLAATRLAAVILAPADADACPVAALITERPYLAFARAAALLHPEPAMQAGIDAGAHIDPGAVVAATARVAAGSTVATGARIGPGVYLGPGCHIGEGVEIGADSRLLGRVSVLAGARLGQRVRVQAGAVIGSEGFGFAESETGWERVPQLGSVTIGDDVDIGANTTIDRGTLEDTVIGEGVRIDNLVQVAHNVVIGAHTAIAGCVGICGSARIGRYCRLGGGVGVIGHIEIADRVTVTAMSLVTRSIRQPGGTWSAGTPLMENSLWRRNTVRLRQLDELARRLKSIEE
ncbi:MAG TPA: UDP-3-O-(3-hydroxymyristoyl)glucosamine N-acyltransferase [Gammaproteobacteria bacterium]|nr:UDP-3-O-(3-hydroxymyristoyl)glucosamine N-acyltransferase [Gammaproteobacteria bacterium]